MTRSAGVATGPGRVAAALALARAGGRMRDAAGHPSAAPDAGGARGAALPHPGRPRPGHLGRRSRWARLGPNPFWQLFVLPAGGRRWSLQTPPDIATNGALVLAAPAAAGQTLVAGVRPSLDLGFSPVTRPATAAGTGPPSRPQSGLADVPDALAAAPDGQLLALGQDRGVTVSAAPAARLDHA